MARKAQPSPVVDAPDKQELPRERQAARRVPLLDIQLLEVSQSGELGARRVAARVTQLGLVGSHGVPALQAPQVQSNIRAQPLRQSSSPRSPRATGDGQRCLISTVISLQRQ